MMTIPTIAARMRAIAIIQIMPILALLDLAVVPKLNHLMLSGSQATPTVGHLLKKCFFFKAIYFALQQHPQDMMHHLLHVPIL